MNEPFRVEREPTHSHPNDRVRARAYDGAVTLFRPTDAAIGLVQKVRGRLEAALGPDVQEAKERFSEIDFFEKIGAVRRELFLEPEFHEAALDVAEAIGFDPDRVAFDPLRLRVVSHNGHENPAAKAVYYAHRDVWYGHPAQLLVVWVPLFDAPACETFAFYPDWFERPAPNDSELFDYDAWVAGGWAKKIGWQDPKTGLTAKYPGLTEPIDVGRDVGFDCCAGETLLFSGAHLHETRRHASGRTRYSLDFRIVDLDDLDAGRGAKLVDARCRGSALPHYVLGARAGARKAGQ